MDWGSRLVHTLLSYLLAVARVVALVFLAFFYCGLLGAGWMHMGGRDATESFPPHLTMVAMLAAGQKMDAYLGEEWGAAYTESDVVDKARLTVSYPLPRLWNKQDDPDYEAELARVRAYASQLVTTASWVSGYLELAVFGLAVILTTLVEMRGRQPAPPAWHPWRWFFYAYVFTLGLFLAMACLIFPWAEDGWLVFGYVLISCFVSIPFMAVLVWLVLFLYYLLDRVQFWLDRLFPRHRPSDPLSEPNHT